MLENELHVASDLARKAGAIIMEVYNGDFDVESKGEAGPVTVADLRANQFLVEELHRAFPDDGIVAEEGSPHIKREGRCWFVDPLDGTKEFIKRNGEFAVMLGLAIEGKAVLGVVYQPAKDKLYRGVVGGQAELVEGENSKILELGTKNDPSDYKLVVSRSHRSKWIDLFSKDLAIHKEKQSGSVGLKIGLIAEGEADIYVHISDKACQWDACAAEAILKAAGGHFSDLHGGDFDYRSAVINNERGILATIHGATDNVISAASEAANAAGFPARE